MSKKHLKRNLHLRKIQKRREAARLPFRVPVGRRSKLQTFRRFFIPILAVATVVGAIYFFGRVGVEKRKKAGDIVANIPQERILRFRYRYPGGYAVIVLTNDRVLMSEYNTLPPELKIRWDYVRVIKMTDEDVRVRFPEVTYTPADIAGMEFKVKFLRQKEHPASVVKQGDFELEIEILEDYGDSIVCLLGLSA